MRHLKCFCCRLREDSLSVVFHLSRGPDHIKSLQLTRKKIASKFLLGSYASILALTKLLSIKGLVHSKSK